MIQGPGVGSVRAGFREMMPEVGYAMRRVLIPLAALVFAPAAVHAQHVHDATSHQTHSRTVSPALAGQDAFAAIAEVIRILEADPATDWSKVDIERLRQHLIDMHEVTLNARVEQTNVEGGFEARVTGTGRTVDAIRRMAHAHGAQMASEGPYRTTVTDIEGGALVRVVVAPGTDPREVAKLRAIGFVGFMALGDHHGPHHLMIARGVSPHAH